MDPFISFGAQFISLCLCLLYSQLAYLTLTHKHVHKHTTFFLIMT